MNEDIVDELRQSTTSTHLVRAVRQSFYLATSISPLLALIPKKYSSESISFRKEALVAVSHTPPVMFWVFLISLISTPCLWAMTSPKSCHRWKDYFGNPYYGLRQEPPSPERFKDSWQHQKHLWQVRAMSAQTGSTVVSLSSTHTLLTDVSLQLLNLLRLRKPAPLHQPSPQ